MSLREKRVFLSLLSLATISLTVFLASFYYRHTRLVAAQGGTYTEGMVGQPRLINPLLASSSPDLALVNIVFSGLYKYDGSGRLLSDLADGFPAISADQKQYTVRLKRNALWHNGKPFTASDVVFTIKTLQDPQYKSPLRNSWLNTSVEKLDDYTVVFRTGDISGPFIHNLTQPILSEAVWGKVDANNFVLSSNNLKALGTGPFAIREIKTLPSGKIQSLKLENFADYYDTPAKLDSLEFKFFDSYEDIINVLHSREIEGFGFNPLDKNLYLARDNKKLRLIKVPLPQYQAVFFNLNNPILADKSVRQALSLASDRGEIVNQAFGGNALAEAGPILPRQLGFVPRVQSRQADLAAAKGLLEEAGWKYSDKLGARAKNNQALEFTITTNDSPINSKTAELLAAQWGKLNIKLHTNVLSGGEFADKAIRSRGFDALIFAQTLGADPDPFAFWHSSQAKAPGFNLTGFANSAADKLISEARNTTDKNLRAQKYQEFQKIIADQQPALFLNQTNFIYALDPQIKNVNLKVLYQSNFRFYDLPNWYIMDKRVWK